MEQQSTSRSTSTTLRSEKIRSIFSCSIFCWHWKLLWDFTSHSSRQVYLSALTAPSYEKWWQLSFCALFMFDLVFIRFSVVVDMASTCFGVKSESHTKADRKWRHTDRMPGDSLSNQPLYCTHVKPQSKHSVIHLEIFRKCSSGKPNAHKSAFCGCSNWR